VAAGLGAYPALVSDGRERLVGSGGALALVVLAGALAGLPSLVPWALLALGGEYAAWFALRGGSVDTRAPLYAAGLLCVAELAYWALDRRTLARAEGELEWRRLGTILLLAIASVGLGAVLLGAAAVSLGRSVAIEALGVVGAVGLLVLLARLTWGERQEEQEL
jgi:hypothetical protein